MSDLNNTSGTPPKNYLVESILLTVLCCPVPGVIGIIKASDVNSKINAGDIEGAQLASAQAKKWVIITLVTAVVIYSIFIAIFVLGIGAAIMSESGGF